MSGIFGGQYNLGIDIQYPDMSGAVQSQKQTGGDGDERKAQIDVPTTFEGMTYDYADRLEGYEQDKREWNSAYMQGVNKYGYKNYINSDEGKNMLQARENILSKQYLLAAQYKVAETMYNTHKTWVSDVDKNEARTQLVLQPDGEGGFIPVLNKTVSKMVGRPIFTTYNNVIQDNENTIFNPNGTPQQPNMPGSIRLYDEKTGKPLWQVAAEEGFSPLVGKLMQTWQNPAHFDVNSYPGALQTIYQEGGDNKSNVKAAITTILRDMPEQQKMSAYDDYWKKIQNGDYSTQARVIDNNGDETGKIDYDKNGQPKIRSYKTWLADQVLTLADKVRTNEIKTINNLSNLPKDIADAQAAKEKMSFFTSILNPDFFDSEVSAGRSTTKIVKMPEYDMLFPSMNVNRQKKLEVPYAEPDRQLTKINVTGLGKRLNDITEVTEKNHPPLISLFPSGTQVLTLGDERSIPLTVDALSGATVVGFSDGYIKGPAFESQQMNAAQLQELSQQATTKNYEPLVRTMGGNIPLVIKEYDVGKRQPWPTSSIIDNSTQGEQISYMRHITGIQGQIKQQYYAIVTIDVPHRAINNIALGRHSLTDKVGYSLKPGNADYDYNFGKAASRDADANTDRIQVLVPINNGLFLDKGTTITNTEMANRLYQMGQYDKGNDVNGTFESLSGQH